MRNLNRLTRGEEPENLFQSIARYLVSIKPVQNPGDHGAGAGARGGGGHDPSPGIGGFLAGRRGRDALGGRHAFDDKKIRGTG